MESDLNYFQLRISTKYLEDLILALVFCYDNNAIHSSNLVRVVRVITALTTLLTTYCIRDETEKTDY